MAARNRRRRAAAKPKSDGTTKLKGAARVRKIDSDGDEYESGDPTNYIITAGDIKLDFSFTCGNRVIFDLTREDAKNLGEALVAASQQ